MLRITGEGVAHTCDGLTRRDFLQVGALGALGLSLVDLAAAEARAKTIAEVAGKDRKSTRLNSSHLRLSRMPSSA